MEYMVTTRSSLAREHQQTPFDQVKMDHLKPRLWQIAVHRDVVIHLDTRTGETRLLKNRFGPLVLPGFNTHRREWVTLTYMDNDKNDKRLLQTVETSRNHVTMIDEHGAEYILEKEGK